MYRPAHQYFPSPVDAGAFENAVDWRSPELLPPFPSSTSKSSSTAASPSTPSSSCPPRRDRWSAEPLGWPSRGGRQGAPRRYSQQDLRTRYARASLLPKHISAASYPTYIPPPHCGPSYTPISHHLAIARGMERPRLHTRPKSQGSSLSTRSSFESRNKSPLSISSSIDYGSSRTSEDSSFSSRNNGLLGSRASVQSDAFGHGRVQSFKEPIVPAYARVGAGGEGRPPTQMPLLTPQRMGMAPPGSAAPTSFGRRYTPRVPGDGFKKLPEEILLVVLAELKKLHLAPGSLSCATCWMRDLGSLALSCRKWWSAVRSVLYEDIQLIGSDSTLHTKKKFKIRYGTRLKLLRRTLRTRPHLAEYVKVLKVPSMPDAAESRKDQNEYLDLVASLIMACPNLERLPGFYPGYNHEFSRFVHALSTRPKLTERVWIMNPSPLQRQHRYELSEDSQFLTPVRAPGLLLPEQSMAFVRYHSNWTHLQTLFLHCNPSGTLDSILFADVINVLPALRNLHVSSFPAAAFNDTTLLALPPLKSLRLDNLPGISSNGLSTYASLPCVNSLKSLSLISLPISSLPVIARLLSHLTSLVSFTFLQYSSPVLPIGVEIFLHPYLASSSLQYLHWEITGSDDSKATDILTKSIASYGFPSLRTIRSPTDFDGYIQRLCKPREKIELPGDRYRNMGSSSYSGVTSVKSISSMHSSSRSTISLGGHQSSGFVKSPTRSTFSLNIDRSNPDDGESEIRGEGMSLTTARRMAQNRIAAAATQPRFQIIIWDENGQFVERFAVGAYMGRVQSKIFYSLKPDVDGLDHAVVRAEGPGGLLDGGEDKAVRDGCIGSWNLDLTAQGKSGMSGMSGMSGKKGKEKWWHTERGRWKEVGLDKFI